MQQLGSSYDNKMVHRAGRAARTAVTQKARYLTVERKIELARAGLGIVPVLAPRVNPKSGRDCRRSGTLGSAAREMH